MNPAVRPIIDRYRAGAISAEIAVMQLLLALGTAEAVRAFLDNVGDDVLARASRDAAGLDRTAALVAAGLADERHSLDAIREQFDRAVAVAPEASVALYSLNSPEILKRATAEIVTRLDEWRLLGPDASVLDIGCGIGRVAQALAPRVRSVTGIDVSPGMIDEARRRCADPSNIEFRVCSGRNLADFPDRAFDLVLAVDSFPYLVAADLAIAARHVADVARLLSPGGALAIFNYSYRGDLAADRRDLAMLAAAHSLVIERNGTRDFTLWDAAAFLLRSPTAPHRRG
jgi:SAM-dependent methyltransferase